MTGGGEGGKGHDDEEEEEMPPTPVPKEWECLGSDLEIRETFMEPGRPLVSEYWSESIHTMDRLFIE